MPFETKPSQVLYLWTLFTVGGEGFVKDQPYQPSAPDRKALVQAGLIEEEQRTSPDTGRKANYNILSDQAWAWLNDHMHAPLPTRSTRGVQVLQALLGCLDTYLTAQQLSLAEFLKPALLLTSAAAPADNLPQRILTACYQIAGQRWDRQVRLAVLRQQLADVSHAELDEALFELQQQQRLLLYAIDNPQALTPADKEAAINISGAGQRHIVYAKG